jgi:hypothetical protein
MSDKPKSSEPKRVTFHLIKGPHFESRQVDGVIGSIGPNRRASLAFFVERDPIPQSITHKVHDDGSLGEVIGATGKPGIVREVQTGVVMDLTGLRTLQNQLTQMLAAIETQSTRDGHE